MARGSIPQDMTDLVVAWLRSHPGSCPADVAAGLGIGPVAAFSALRDAESQGVVRRRPGEIWWEAEAA